MHRQFLLSAEPCPHPPDWEATPLEDLVVYRARNLPWIDLRFPAGRAVVLGWPIFEGRLWQDGETLIYPCAEAEDGFPALAGRFLVLVRRQGSWRCYPDPCALLPIVYSAERRIAAATPMLIPDPGERAPTGPESHPGEYWYPFGATAFPNVTRLLPNHWLDLDSFTTGRFWPRRFADERVGETDLLLARIAGMLVKNIEAIAVHPRVMANLTAGRDTRMLLAALRSRCRDVVFSTFRFPGAGGAQDCATASAIARTFSLDHRQFTPLPPEADDVAEWLENTGYCVVGQAAQLATTGKQIAGLADFNLTGLIGELGRATYWTARDLVRTEIGVELLLRRTQVPNPEAFLVPAQAWLDGLPPGPVHWNLDLFAMEIRFGSFTAPSFFGNCHGAVSLTPFNDRKMIELMFALPADYRFAQRLAPDLIDILWPELNAWPFNQAAASVAAAPVPAPRGS